MTLSFKNFSSIVLLFFFTLSQAQTREFSGIVKADGNVEGIHIINKTSYRYATTDKSGGFIIQAKLSDSLYFSSIQYTPKIVVITPNILKDSFIEVSLEDSVTELDEVTVGKILTGDLNSDITNSDAERPLDFYDVGIPGYTGTRKTQIESRLYEADAGKMVYLGFPYAVLNLNKFLNKITGRTKKLKQAVKIEKERNILTQIKEVVGPELFKIENLSEDLVPQFYYFCADDPNFQQRCANRSDVQILQFLQEKLKEFKANNLSEN